jgi:hypothetical protein
MKLTTLLAALIALSPALASADEAADHVAKATRSYNIQDWAHALAEYKQAYTLDPKPETLWAIAQTQRLSGDCRSAILTYKAYMRTASTAGANAALDFIKTCEADIEAQRRVVEAATTAPQPQPEPSQTPPPAQPSQPPPQPNQQPALQMTPAPKPAGPPGLLSDPLGDTVLGVGVVGVVTGAALLAVGAIDLGDADSKSTSGARNSAVSSAQTDQIIGAIAGGVGVACVALAFWRIRSVHAHAAEHPSTSWIIAPHGDGAIAAFTARF